MRITSRRLGAPVGPGDRRHTRGRKIVLDTKLFRHGELSREVLGTIKREGVEFVDQLDARLALAK